MKKQLQQYETYTLEDFQVWKLLYERQVAQLPGAAIQEYINGINRVGFVADKIPKFIETNVLLHKYTGWELVVVPGLIPDKDFFELLSNKKFPASTWLRKLSELDYLEEPDMFHDVFGHVPLLTNHDVVSYLQDLSKIALGYIDNAWAIELMSRIYWFTVEFGLIRENGELRIYGAGILSSKGETVYSLHDLKPTRHPFNVEKILNTPYRKDEFQKDYFVIDSFQQLSGCIDDLARLMEQMAHAPKN
jgi:phenylalanine-4-hydroxylase